MLGILALNSTTVWWTSRLCSLLMAEAKQFAIDGAGVADHDPKHMDLGFLTLL